MGVGASTELKSGCLRMAVTWLTSWTKREERWERMLWDVVLAFWWRWRAWP